MSASGRRLGGGDVEAAWKKFLQLPESERAPGAVKVEEHGPVDAKIAAPEPPACGLVLKIYGRILTREADGTLRFANAADCPLMSTEDDKHVRNESWMFESHPDFLWVTEAEWRSLLPPNPARGDWVQVPETLAMRIAKFHLTPQRIYGEGGEWHREQIRHADVRVTVDDVTPAGLRLLVRGSCEMGSEFDADKATTPNGPLARGYAAELEGVLFYDSKKGAFTRFDILALGETWGRMGDANNKSIKLERPGKVPLAFAFQLATDAPADRLIPTGRASKVRKGYLDVETRKQ